MNRAVAASSTGFVGRPASRRVIPRYATIIGKADGNIIATIMTTRRAKKRTRSVDRNREGAVSAIRTSAEVHVAYQAAPTARTTAAATDRKSTRLNSSHLVISYAVFCLKKK